MSGPLDAVIDDFASERRELIALNPPGVSTGFWTFRPPLVADVVDAVEAKIQPELRRLD